LQRRRNLVYDGNPPPEKEEDIPELKTKPGANAEEQDIRATSPEAPPTAISPERPSTDATPALPAAAPSI
jgi:hypothetical protein